MSHKQHNPIIYIFILCFISILMPTNSHGFAYGWVKTGLGSGLSTDMYGNVYTVGSKIDATGTPITSYPEFGSFINIDSNGNKILVGTYTGIVDFDPTAGIDQRTPFTGTDTFITKINANGTYAWTKTLADFGVVNDVKLDANDNIIISGTFIGTKDFDPGVSVVSHTTGSSNVNYILKLSPNGLYLWSGVDSYPSTSAITVDNYGDNVLLYRSYSANWQSPALDIDPTAGVDNYTLASGQTARFLTTLKLGGAYVSSLQLPAAVAAISADSYGNIFLLGSFTGSVDFDPNLGVDTQSTLATSSLYLTKLNPDQSYAWTKVISPANATSTINGKALAIDAKGNIFITGDFNGTVDFNFQAASDFKVVTRNSMFVTKIAQDGSYHFAKIISGTKAGNYSSSYYRLIPNHAHIDNNGDIILRGYSRGHTSIDFDPTAAGKDIVSVSPTNAKFVVKLILQSPSLTEITPIRTPNNTSTPAYTFSSTEAGSLILAGDCSSTSNNVTVGSNTITFNTLTDGNHANCTITVTNAIENTSEPLTISPFTIDTIAPSTPVISSPISHIITNTTARPAINGSAESGANINIRDNNSSLGLITASGGNWSLAGGGALLAEGVHSFSATATDAAGNKSPASAAVLRTIDTTPPVINIPTGIRVEALSKLGTSKNTTSIQTFLNAATTSDTVDGAGLATHNALQALPLGVNTITFSATDATGNVSSPVSATITIVDTTAPVVTPPSTVTAEATGIKTPTTLGSATAMDTVQGALTPSALNTGPFPLGTTNVTWSVTDRYGNTGTAIQKVVIQDTTPPVFTAINLPDITQESTSPYSAVSLTIPATTDIFAVTVTNNAPSTFQVGTTVVVWAAQDSNGNKATLNQNIILQDTTSPVISLIGGADVYTEAGAVYRDKGASSSDAVDGNKNVLGVGAVNTNNVGTYTLTYNITDAAGNTATAVMRRVYVQDTTAPIITVNGLLDTYSELGVSYTDLGASSFDAIDGNKSVIGVGNVNVNAVGNYNLTYDITDSYSNVATQVIRWVYVKDTTPPVIQSLPMTGIVFEALGKTNSVPLTAPQATDLSGVTITSNAPSLFGMGVQSVKWTAKDAFGNFSAAVQTVKVQDTTPPVFTAFNLPDITKESTSPYSYVALVTPIATDVFPVVITSSAPAAFPVGTTIVTWVAQDSYSNTSLISQNVIMTDTTAPVLTLNGLTDVYIEAGNTYLEHGATLTDLVDGYSQVLSLDVVDTYTLGTYNVNYSGADHKGNIALPIQRKIHIEDNTAPVFLNLPLKQMTIKTDGTQGQLTLKQPTVSDLFKVTLSNDSLSFYPIGTTTVTWTATDENGNSSTATQVVSVEKNTASITQSGTVNDNSADSPAKSLPSGCIAPLPSQNLVGLTPMVAIFIFIMFFATTRKRRIKK